MIFNENLTIQEKLAILADGAKYDVACTSSGVERKGRKGEIGNTAASGICHSFAADGRCISLLKILFTNECIFNCRYCINRSSNDVPRATFTPEEVCTLTMEFYKRNYIEGLFLSSGIVDSPDHTMELICQTLRDLRTVHRFNGYIHCKAIPGAASALIEEAGWYADRMSVNLEFPTAKGLRELAPNKTREHILTPMRQIQKGVQESRELLGMKGGNQSAYWYTQKRLGRELPGNGFSGRQIADTGRTKTEPLEGLAEPGADSLLEGIAARGKSGGLEGLAESGADSSLEGIAVRGKSGVPGLSLTGKRDFSRGFVPGGQSTQMIIGATGESDYEIITVTEALYQRFDLKRVFFSAFINVNQDSTLPALNGEPPLRREHRLYQADFLMRYYGFQAGELLSEKRPFFNTYLDPKCDWALGHLELFPVEVSKADYQTLLRVPGIGTKSAKRIIKARRTGKLDFQSLKTMGVVLKRAIYFITCYGKMMYHFMKMDEDYITRNLLDNDKDVMKGFGENVTYRQLSLFDDNMEGYSVKNNFE